MIYELEVVTPVMTYSLLKNDLKITSIWKKAEKITPPLVKKKPTYSYR